MGKAKFGGFGGGMGGMGGGMNMQNMIKQAQKMQQDMLKAQEEIANRETTITAGGGMITVTVQGTSQLSAITIQPDIVDPDDIEMLQDTMLAAVNEALRAAAEASEEEMKKVTGGNAMPGMF